MEFSCCHVNVHEMDNGSFHVVVLMFSVNVSC